jgi:hypothetical protein
VPADLGGVIFLFLENQSSLPIVQENLAQFLIKAIRRDPLVNWGVFSCKFQDESETAVPFS